MRNWHWFVLSSVIILLDQLSKYFAMQSLLPYQPIPLLPVLNFTLAFNTGSAFSFLSKSGEWHRWFFAVFSLLMSIFLIVWILRSRKTARMQLLALSLILGGAVGNLVDRVMQGHVIDFIEIYYKQFHWPVFNLADSAICIGAVLLFIDLCKNPRT
jgi:signal peptidase II